MRKLILLAILAALGWWYFDGSRRMSEADIRDSYAADQDAFSRLDADSLCQRMDEHFSLTQTVNGVEHHAGKADTCAGFKDTFEGLRRMGVGRMPFHMETTIEAIALAPDRKSATVTATSVMQLGPMTLTRTHGSEQLIRRSGKILSLGGQTRVWMYSGE